MIYLSTKIVRSDFLDDYLPFPVNLLIILCRPYPNFQSLSDLHTSNITIGSNQFFAKYFFHLCVNGKAMSEDH